MKAISTNVLLMTIIAFLALPVQTHARARIPVGSIESLKKVADLPNTDEYKIEDGQYADVGVLYETFTIAFVPLWVTKEPVLVAYNEKDDTYLNIPDKDMDVMLQQNKLEKEKLLELGFFTRYGGKLIGLALLALIIYGLIPSKKDKKDILPNRI